MASRAATRSRSRASSTKRGKDLESNVTPAVTSPAADSPAGIDEWITRGEVAGLMGVSITTVRRLQGRDLHPRRSADGVYLFDPREVEEVRARRPPPPEKVDSLGPGELAAAAFKLFRDGVDVRDAVIALARQPAEVEALYADWERLGDMLFISWRIRSELSRMARHGLIDPDVLEAVEDDDPATLSALVSEAISA